MLLFADLILTAVHVGLIVFNLTGWIWSRTRRAHIVVLSATFASWFGLGVVYGWGYCPITDWQWRVKWARGESGLPASFVKYFADRLTGSSWDPAVIDAITVLSALGALTLSVVLLMRERKRQRAATEAG